MLRRFFRVVPAILALFGISVRNASSVTWKLVEQPETTESPVRPGMTYTKQVLRRDSDGKTVTVQLALFNSTNFRLSVIDLGAGASSIYSSIRDAFHRNGCLAGVNGGFFQEDFRPLGLMVAAGQKIHRLENSKLLSGVIYCDDKGIHLMRRAAFVDHPEITALLQAGPYLIEGGLPVRGLSPRNSDRRTFIATDWRRNWGIGTCSPLTLEELAELLSTVPFVTGWRIDRAINLDGGSSSAFYFSRPNQEGDVFVPNWKRVRNLVGIAPK